MTKDRSAHQPADQVGSGERIADGGGVHHVFNVLGGYRHRLVAREHEHAVGAELDDDLFGTGIL